MKTITFFAAACIFSAAGLHAADGKARTLEERVAKDSRLELCIDKKESNAIRCLKKYGYLDGKAQRVTADGLETDTDDGRPVGHRKGLLQNPGQRIQPPNFGSSSRESRTGPAISPIQIERPASSFSGGVGIHSGGKDKQPTPNPSGAVR